MNSSTGLSCAKARYRARSAALLATAASALFLVAATTALAQDRDVEVNVTPVGGAVHMLEGAGGNLGVSAGEDGVLIIDDQFDWIAPKIRAALSKLGSGKPKFILNTHWHGDHTGGNKVFGADGTIVAHENVRQRLESGGSVLGRDAPPAPRVALPVITFDEELSVHFNGERIRAHHMPRAHTDGDIVIFFTKSNVVHMGDTFFAERFPFVDLGSGGSVPGLIAGIEGVLPQIPKSAAIIPGHGPVSTIDGLKTYLAMLKKTAAIVKDGMDAGMSKEEIVAKGLGEKWKGWGSGFIDEERWIGILHESLGAAD